MLKAGTLIYAIFISFLITSICGLLVLLSLIYNKDFNRIFNRIIGMDIDIDSLLIAKKLGMPLINADANNLPFKDKTFDVILNVDLMSVEGIDESNMIIEIERVLKPEGFLIVNVPAIPKLFSQHDLTVGNRKRYKKQDIYKIFTYKNWTVIKCSYWSFFVLPFVFIQRKFIGILFAGIYTSDLVHMPRIVNKLFEMIYKAEFPLFMYSLNPLGISLFTLLKRK